MIIQASHGDKLQALLRNNKLPPTDKPKVIEAIEKYINSKGVQVSND